MEIVGEWAKIKLMGGAATPRHPQSRMTLARVILLREQEAFVMSDLSRKLEFAGITTEIVAPRIIVAPKTDASQLYLDSAIDPTMGATGNRITPEQRKKLVRALKRVGRRMQFRLFLSLLRLHIGKFFFDCRYAILKTQSAVLSYFGNHFLYRHIVPPSHKKGPF